MVYHFVRSIRKTFVEYTLLRPVLLRSFVELSKSILLIRIFRIWCQIFWFNIVMLVLDVVVFIWISVKIFSFTTGTSLSVRYIFYWISRYNCLTEMTMPCQRSLRRLKYQNNIEVLGNIFFDKSARLIHIVSSPYSPFRSLLSDLLLLAALFCKRQLQHCYVKLGNSMKHNFSFSGSKVYFIQILFNSFQIQLTIHCSEFIDV